MALSSQSRREVIGSRSAGSSGGWSRRSRQRQRRNRRVVGLLLIAGATVGGWWLMGKPGTNPTAPIATAPATESETLPDPINTPPAHETMLADSSDREEPATTIAATPETNSAPVFRMGEPIAATDLSTQITRATRAPERRDEDFEAPDESGAMPERPVFASPPEVQERILVGYEAIDQNRLVDARRVLSEALLDERTAPADKASLRGRITSINERLLFSPTIVSDDPLVSRYVIEPGDALSRIGRKTGAKVDWRFIQRINQISDPRRIRVGQTLKIVSGPFHAVVDKSDYRMDVYAETPTSAGGGVVFVKSFPVGLGELGSTPTGEWIVRDDSKLINPDWTNPRTGERFNKDNPLNPIGERWVGLRGIDPTTEALSGYGIHGTIEPSSIGQQRSMGCVRLLDDDVSIVYEMLVEGVSRVAIVE